MSEVKIGEVDTDTMSEEELGSYLTELEAKAKADAQTEEVENTESEEPTAEEESSDETPSASQEESESSTPETEEISKKETTDVEPQYQGKSKDDLLDMQRNANRKISQQENELYHLKKQLEEFKEEKARPSAPKEVEKSSLEDELLEKYNPEDRNAIQTLINREFSKRENSRIEAAKAEKKAIMAEHDEMWEHLKVFNPKLFNSVESKAMEEMRANQENTYQRKGWMKEFITEQIKGAQEVKPKAKSVTKKRTTTIKSGGAIPQSSKFSNKQVENMTQDEYEKYLKSQGLNI